MCKYSIYFFSSNKIVEKKSIFSFSYFSSDNFILPKVIEFVNQTELNVKSPGKSRKVVDF